MILDSEERKGGEEEEKDGTEEKEGAGARETAQEGAGKPGVEPEPTGKPSIIRQLREYVPPAPAAPGTGRERGREAAV